MQAFLLTSCSGGTLQRCNSNDEVMADTNDIATALPDTQGVSQSFSAGMATTTPSSRMRASVSSVPLWAWWQARPNSKIFQITTTVAVVSLQKPSGQPLPHRSLGRPRKALIVPVEFVHLAPEKTSLLVHT